MFYRRLTMSLLSLVYVLNDFLNYVYFYYDCRYTPWWLITIFEVLKLNLKYLFILIPITKILAHSLEMIIAFGRETVYDQSITRTTIIIIYRYEEMYHHQKWFRKNVINSCENNSSLRVFMSNNSKTVQMTNFRKT